MGPGMYGAPEAIRKLAKDCLSVNPAERPQFELINAIIQEAYKKAMRSPAAVRGAPDPETPQTPQTP